MSICAPENKVQQEAGNILAVILFKMSKTILREQSRGFPIKNLLLLINASTHILLFLPSIITYQGQFQASAYTFILAQKQTTFPIN